MVLLAVLFPLLICVFLMVMERLEASLLPARFPVPAGADGPAGAAAGGGDAGDGAPPERTAVPLPRRPSRDGVPAGPPPGPR